MSQNNKSKEVMFKAQSSLKVIFYCHEPISRNLYWTIHITHLGCHQSIYSPCHRRCPIIPPPPYWNLLQSGKQLLHLCYSYHTKNKKYFFIFSDHTYRSWNKKTREQVPKTDEERHHDGSNLVVWCQGHRHHSIQCEVDKGHEYEEVKPNEVFDLWLEPNHPVEDSGVYQTLDCNINDFNRNLQKQLF